MSKEFPIYHKGKNYYEKDCCEIFLNCYVGKDRLIDIEHNGGKGIYLSDGMYIFPDGTTYDDKN